MLADSVGLALPVVLEALDPAERLAFVLHDVFGMTFDEIAPIVDRSPVAARQLASRARRRVEGSVPDADALQQQRRVVDAFLAAAREGDFERLITVLDPDIVVRADGGALAGASRVVRGAQAVAEQAETFSKLGLSNQVVLVNGNVGLLSRRPDGRLFSVIGLTIARGKIAEVPQVATVRVERTVIPVAEIAGGHHAEGADGGQRADLRTAQRHVTVPRPDALAFTTTWQLDVTRQHVSRVQPLAFAWIGQPTSARLRPPNPVCAQPRAGPSRPSQAPVFPDGRARAGIAGQCRRASLSSVLCC